MHTYYVYMHIHTYTHILHTHIERNVLFFKNVFIYLVIYFLLLLFSYSCPVFSPLFIPTLSPPYSYSQSSPLSMLISLLFVFLGLPLPLLSCVMPLLSPLWSLSVYSLFPSLWFYFAHLFVLLISSTYRWHHMAFVFHCLAYFP